MNLPGHPLGLAEQMDLPEYFLVSAEPLLTVHCLQTWRDLLRVLVPASTRFPPTSDLFHHRLRRCCLCWLRPCRCPRLRLHHCHGRCLRRRLRPHRCRCHCRYHFRCLHRCLCPYPCLRHYPHRCLRYHRRRQPRRQCPRHRPTSRLSEGRFPAPSRAHTLAVTSKAGRSARPARIWQWQSVSGCAAEPGRPWQHRLKKSGRRRDPDSNRSRASGNACRSIPPPRCGAQPSSVGRNSDKR